MARDKDSDTSSTSQSKRPALSHLDSDSQVSDQAQQQSAQPQPHRNKAQKRVVGGGVGGRLHARVPSSKALQKHHASASTSKLNRRHGSLSPDRAPAGPLASNHRRATSELKLSRDSSSTQLSKNPSQTSLKRNKSNADVGRKSKSATNLKRTSSHRSVEKLKPGAGSNKVHFNLGDDGQDDEWVDASATASPHLSRRASAAEGRQSANPPASASSSRPQSPNASDEDEQSTEVEVEAVDGSQKMYEPERAAASHKQYLTSRLLQRTPSYGAPPMMTAENAIVRPASSARQHSPGSGIDRGDAPSSPPSMVCSRPGSSGKEGLTSRFVGNNSQGSGSVIPGESFLTAVHRGGLAGLSDDKPENDKPRRPRSMNNLDEAHDQTAETVVGQGTPNEDDDSPLTDEEEDVDNKGLTTTARLNRPGTFALPRDMNRTQQKLNLQRASSTLESTHPHPHPHPGVGIGLGMEGIGLTGGAAAAGPLIGGSGYDSRDPRLAKFLENTGMEYLVVRRYQNPIARSLNRIMQRPGLDKPRRIPRPGTAQSKRASDELGRNSLDVNPQGREMSAAGLIGTQTGKRPSTPRRGFAMVEPDGGISSNGSRAGAGPMDDNPARLHEGSQRLSGSSLVEDEGTDIETLLRNLWDKPMDLGASQD